MLRRPNGIARRQPKGSRRRNSISTRCRRSDAIDASGRAAPSRQARDLLYKIGNRIGIIEIEDRKLRVCDRMIGGNGADVRIGWRQGLAVGRFQAARLDLRDRLALIAFDQDQIARGEPGEDLLETRFRRAAQFMHDGKART
ncbi:hypothetical protein D3C86_1861700 [compost metagenome]